MVTIRTERADDHAQVHAVHCAAFPTDAEARLVDSLRTSDKAVVSLVAEINKRIIGHILFSPVSIERAAGGAFGVGLAPVAVFPTHQRQGIGSRLVEQGIAACRQAGLEFIVVLGEPSFYQRFGFTQASRFGLDNEYGADEAFMVLELRPNCLSRHKAIVRYSPQFTVFGGGS